MIASILVMTLAGAAVAIASNATPPRVVSPTDGDKLKADHVVLVVDDPGLSGIGAPVFLVVAHARHVDKHGHLTFHADRCGPRCDYEEMSPWTGHPGMWIYRATYNDIPAYWGATPGTYYWQVYHYVPSCTPLCAEYSAIHKFRVVR